MSVCIGQGGMGEEGRERGEKGTRSGPQFERNDPPPLSDGWLWACIVRTKFEVHSFTRS